MLQGLCDRDPFLGVELQHAHQQVQGLLGSIALEPLPDMLHFEVADRIDHWLGDFRIQRKDIFSPWLSGEGENFFQLV